MKSKLPNLIGLVLAGAIVTIVVATLGDRAPRRKAMGQGCGGVSRSPNASYGKGTGVLSDGPWRGQAEVAGRLPSSWHLCAATGSPTPGSSPVQGGRLIQRALVALEGYYSVSARVRQCADLFGKQLVGSGIYLQQRSPQGIMFRFEMRVQLHDQVNSLLDVCDGQYVWRYRKLRDHQSLSRIDLMRVTQALEEAGRGLQPGEMGQWPAVGGLAKMLGGINQTFDFVAIEETRLWQQLPTWKLEGQWKPGELVKLLPAQKQAIEAGKSVDLSKLSEHLPDRVVLFLGAEDLFPYRIEYHRRFPELEEESSSGDRLLVGIDFFEVNLNVRIDPARFMYSPGNLGYSDKTPAVLERLGLK